MNTSNPEMDLHALLEELKQENFNLDRNFELVDLEIETLDEEDEYEEELMADGCEKFVQQKEDTKKQIMVDNNQLFLESRSFLDESLAHHLSSSYLEASTLDVSTVMEASICEPEEITTLSNEIQENKISLREIRSKVEDKKILLQEVKIQNLVAENGNKQYRSEQKMLKEEVTEKEEDLLMMQSEMSVLPNRDKASSTQDSIYAELVRGLEATKGELNEKKAKVVQYVDLLHKLETDCKYFEGEILVLDVYDGEDETRRLQSQANILEAYKNFYKELDKNIQTLQTSITDVPALLRTNCDDSSVFFTTVNKYVDYVAARLKKLNHELTYHKLELTSVQDKETSLQSNVKMLSSEASKMKRELERLVREIADVKSGVKKPAPVASKAELKSTQPAAPAVKTKSVRFQTPQKEKGDATGGADAEESENKENQEAKKRPMEKMEKQPQKIVIHKRRNRKPVNIIKHC